NGGKTRLGSAPAAAPTDLRVPELLHSDWSQGRIGNWAGTDFPYCFNMYTPEINGERAVCGCVATSGAQIMRYFQYPVASVTPQTKTCEVEGVETSLTMMGGTYDWANMPTNINSMYSQPESATLAYREAIGKLTYDIGVSVGMSYGANGSGAAERALANALVNVFGYRKAAYFYTNGGFSTDKLKKAILPNLDAKRPCGIGIANTSTEAGHAIVADGYGYSDGTLYIHFNMGWANIYGSNAWYTPPEFDVNGVTEYDVIDEVICNIFTDTGSEFGSIASGRVLDGSGNPIPGATVTGTTTMLNGVVTNIVTTSDERGVYAILLPAVERPCTIKATTAGNVASSEVTFNIALTDISIGNTYDNDLVVDRVPAPTISPDGGSFYEGSLDVTITCPLSGATIRYTLDGTEPTASSPSVANGGTVSVTRSLTLKAKAFMDGYTESATASATFTHIVDLETPDCLLEYVQTGNNQFIDTGINAASGIKVEFNFRWLGYNGSGYNVMLGAQSPNNSFSPHMLQNRWIAYRYNNSRWYIESYATRTENIGDKQMTMDSDCVFTVSISPSGAFETVVKGAGFTEATATRNLGSSCNVGRDLYLFANNNDGTANEFANVRCYGVKMWQADANGDWQLVRDFRPCKRYDRAAMWDAVSGKIFFSGSGTDLTAGPVVTPEFERKAVDYVESTGSQYINTGVCPKYGTKAEVKFSRTSEVGTYDVLLGSGGTGGYYYFGCVRSPSYIGAGCGSRRAYADANASYGFADSCYLLDSRQIANGTQYTITTELSPEGDYNINTLGGRIDGGYAYHKTKIVEQGDFLSSDKPLYVFASNNNGSLADPYKIRFYSAKIWQTNGVDGTYVLLRDMTPCQKDGRGALYDSVNDEVLFPGAGELLTSNSGVWNNTAGDGLFENPANWSTGAVPTDGDSVTVNVSGETTLIVTGRYALPQLSVTGNGTLAFVGDGSLSYKRLNIASGATVVRTGTAGLIDGGLTGAGSFVLDPGAGNTLTMTKSNTGFTGEAVVKSGTVKLGNSTSFGSFNRASFIRVKGGATLDEADATDGNYGDRKEKNKVILEEGATFVHSGSNTDDKTYPVTRLTLEGNATVDTSIKDVAIGLHYHDWYSHIDLGTNTLTVTGGKIFRISVCEISGSGTIDIQSGTKVYSTHEYDTTATVTTCNDGTINIREAATWHLYRYAVNGGRDGNLSVKNLVLDGAVTREQPASTLTVTGAITGKGTTPMLTMAEGAVFKPNGTGYLTVTESLSGTMTIDASGLDLASTYGKIPLFKVSSAEMLSSVSVDFAAGTKPRNWVFVKTSDGLGYDLVRTGFSIILR
ncbi:MAG: C10 family peptidase, partial [Kiritimatiellae bacterium]|nr:C10 family peptidase [Kiritimatiellia bacterium]